MPYPSAGGFEQGAQPAAFVPWAVWETLRDGWRLPIGEAKLEPVAGERPLADRDIPVIVVTRNEMGLLQSFLAHYRSLGVSRFLVVDDQSSDGTAEFLAAQPDVDLYRSNIRYGEAYRGRLWRQMMTERYGRGRWYVLVDVDEFLVTSPRLDIREIADRLARRRVFHLAAPMLDMYPPGPVEEASLPEGAMPVSVASHYDAGGYRLTGYARGWRLHGGPRQRLFGQKLELMKYPLVFWDRFSGLKRMIHTPTPYWRNLAPFYGVLLHFKFLSDFRVRFADAVKNAQHHAGAWAYSDMLTQIKEAQRFEMMSASVSRPYAGATDLVERGFMVDLPR
jgi:hypothetical protein